MENKNNRINFLKKVINVAQRDLDELPETSLVFSNAQGKKFTNFYELWYNSEGERIRRYLRRRDPKDMKLLRELAQKEYLQKVKEAAETELKNINKLQEIQITCANTIRPEDVQETMPQTIRDLIRPIIKPSDDWQNLPFERKPADDRHIYKTQKGEFVCSKSELMIANTLFELGIPYRYECALKMKDGLVFHPDFTILKVKTNEVFYHEHCGMLGRERYSDDFIIRLKEYAKIGIYPGVNLSLSFESENVGIDLPNVRTLFKLLYT